MNYFRCGGGRSTHTATKIDVAKTPLASFESNVSGLYLPEILAYIQATQAGSDDPSPSNPRAISGVSSVDTTRTGKNLFDYSDSGITLSGFSNNNGVFTNNNTDTRTSFRPAIQLINGSTITATITMSGEVGINSVTFTIADTITKLRIKHNGASQDLRIDYPFTKTGTFTFSMTVTANNPSVVGGLSIKDVQLELGNTATPYKAYTGTTATTSLGGTYYGGYLNVPTGLLTVTWSDKFTIDGSVSVVSVAQSGSVYYISVRTNLTGVNTTLSNKTVISDKMKTSTGLVADNRCYITNGGATLVCILSDQTITTKEQANQWFSDNPTTFCYELATPQTVQLTPAQLEQLLGQNNVFCSSGDVAVKYWKID